MGREGYIDGSSLKQKRGLSDRVGKVLTFQTFLLLVLEDGGVKKWWRGAAEGMGKKASVQLGKVRLPRTSVRLGATGV